MFKSKRKKPKFIVTEGLEGIWYYHISRKDDSTKSLCGENVMYSNMSLDEWNTEPTHIPYKFCKRCQELMEKEINNA